MTKETFVAIMKYMDLRIKGFGAGLTDKEINILHNLSDAESNALYIAILELGGSLPEGCNPPAKPNPEEASFSKVLMGIWIHGHKWAVEQVKNKLRE